MFRKSLEFFASINEIIPTSSPSFNLFIEKLKIGPFSVLAPVIVPAITGFYLLHKGMLYTIFAPLYMAISVVPIPMLATAIFIKLMRQPESLQNIFDPAEQRPVQETRNPQEQNLQPNRNTTNIILAALPIITALKKNTELNDKLNDFSPYVQDYINSFKNKQPIEDLKLSEEEEKRLNDYYDPVSKCIINIPVILNEKTYDLNSLEMILNDTKKDPISRHKFTRRDIQAARDVNEKIQDILKQIIEDRSNSSYNGPEVTTAPVMKLASSI